MFEFNKTLYKYISITNLYLILLPTVSFFLILVRGVICEVNLLLLLTVPTLPKSSKKNPVIPVIRNTNLSDFRA